MTIEQKKMIIADEHKEEARDYLKQRLFNAGLYGLSGDTLFPKSKDAERFYQMLNIGLDKDSYDFNYTDLFKGLYGDKYKIVESNMITNFKKLTQSNLTPCLLFRIIREEVLKEWGEFTYDL